jgi:hypothetical protein
LEVIIIIHFFDRRTCFSGATGLLDTGFDVPLGLPIGSASRDIFCCGLLGLLRQASRTAVVSRRDTDAQP